jgi:hypothetical protein
MEGVATDLAVKDLAEGLLAFNKFHNTTVQVGVQSVGVCAGEIINNVPLATQVQLVLMVAGAVRFSRESLCGLSGALARSGEK